MITRREMLGLTLGAGAALTLRPSLLQGLIPARAELITRAIPSSGEQIPLVGLGSSATFAQVARSEDVSALTEVFRTMAELGGRVFDTAPAYGASEEVAGRIARELGITDRIFWATKVNVAGPGGGSADPAAARAQIEASFRKFHTDTIDLIQVHGLADVSTQLGVLKELKAEGRVRYIGIAHTGAPGYDNLAAVMRNEPIDFIGVDYAIDNRGAEEMILPLAMERRIGVLVYLPFGRARLWNRVAGQQVPAWAAEELDATSWAQFFLKFVAAHPAVTAITPATSQARHMAENMGAARGRLPDEATRRRMIEVVNALPAAAAAAAAAAPAFTPVAVPVEVLERYVGEYEISPAMTITVRRSGDSLTAQPGNQSAAVLDARSETRFQVRGAPVELEFVTDAAGVVSLVLHQGGQEIRARRRSP
jgi:aryl-alcohol dehydrogenase-like predicted oxidoreductase